MLNAYSNLLYAHSKYSGSNISINPLFLCPVWRFFLLFRRHHVGAKCRCIVPDRRMWAQQAPSTQQHEKGNCVNACVNVNCDCNELKEYDTKENYVYVSPCNSVVTLFSCDVYLCDL
jgi:hypothetical protein